MCKLWQLADLATLFLVMAVAGCHDSGFWTGRPLGLWKLRVVHGEKEFHKEAVLRAGEYDVGPMSLFWISPHYDDSRALAVSESDYRTYGERANLWKLDLDTLEFSLDRRSTGGRYIDVDGDGNYESIGGTVGGNSAVWVADAFGRVLWRMPSAARREDSAHCVTVGDLDGDGIQEFYVGTKQGLMRKEFDGSTVWQVGEGPFRRVRTLAASDWGGSEGVIVSMVRTSYGYSRFEIRRPDGKLVRKFNVQSDLDFWWYLLPWPTDDSTFGIVGRTRTSIVCLDDHGDIMWTYPFPKKLGMAGYNLVADMVQFRDGGPWYVVTKSGSVWGWRRDLLCVLTLDGTPAYVELFEQARFAVAALGARPESTERVLFVSTNAKLHTKESPPTLYAYWPREREESGE